VQVNTLGPVPVKGLAKPVEVFELVGASGTRRRVQAAAARGLTRFVGRQTELATLADALAWAGAGHGQVVALVGEAGVGKSRLVYECVHVHHTRGWLVLESASVSYGKATPDFPVIDLLKRYNHAEERDDSRIIRAKVTGQVLTLDATLQDTVPALLALLDALPDNDPFLRLDPPQRRQRTLEALTRVLLRESQVQPLLLVFEDLHWIDTETQALLDRLVDSLPTAHLLLPVNYRPEYQHGWGSKTYYTQLRPDPLPPASAEALLATLLGHDPSVQPLMQLLITRTQGNPFFLEESVRALVQAGVLAGIPGAYHLVQALPTIQVPESHDTQEQAIDLRLDLRSALFPLGDLGRILVLLQEAIDLAEALGDQPRLGWVSAFLLAHFVFAGDPDRALASGQRALAIATALGDIGLTAVAQIYLGHAYHDLGEYRRAVECFQKNVAALHGELLHEHFGLPGLVSVFSRSFLVRSLAECGAFTEGKAPAEEGVRIAEAADHPFSRVVMYSDVGYWSLRQGDLHQAIPLLKRALELAQVAHLRVLVPPAASSLGVAYALTGRTADALPLLEQAVEQGVAMRHMRNYALWAAWLGEAYLLAGRLDEASAQAQRALDFAQAR
jgi:tetratricopeptide (TPR) repeat protein